jgi:O-antigen/teichoic acid export membrane protein
VLDNLLAPWRAKYNTVVASIACYAVAGIAGAVSLAFGLAALYSWLKELFGPIIACLIIAGAFLVIAIIPMLILRGITRREERRVAEAAARARTTQWVSPATLSLGLQAARILGKNRGLAMGAVGALVLGWLASRMMPNGGAETSDPPGDDPAE